MRLIFIGLLLLLVALYFISKSRYSDFIEPLDKKAYPFKELFPIPLFLLEKGKYRYGTKYDRLVLSKLVQTVEPKYSQYYLRIYWANKLTFFLLSLLFVSFIGAFGNVDASFALFAVALPSGVIYFAYYDLNEKVKKRRILIQLDFPDFINKLTLLINAGMTIQRAWEKIVVDNKRERPLYEELQMVVTDIQAGKPENKAYEDFAKRCRTPEITKFVTVVLQNVKKGTGDMVSILRVQSNECWEMRKNTAKRMGEEASTKMLFPMMIMFIAILIIVVTPAVLAMRGV